MIKAIIFDFDETISNRSKGIYIGYKQFIKKVLNLEEGIELEALTNRMITVDIKGYAPYKDRLRFLVEEHGASESIYDEFKNWWYDYSPNITPLNDGAIDILKDLRKQGYKLGLLSNGNSKSQNAKIDVVNIREYFDSVCVGGDIGYSKPDVRAYEYICEEIGVKAEECIFVGDTFYTDILGAVKAGMKPIWLCSDKAVVLDYPCERISELSEVIQAIKRLTNK